MLEFANLPSEEQVVYFQQTAEKMDLPPHLMKRTSGFASHFEHYSRCLISVNT